MGYGLEFNINGQNYSILSWGVNSYVGTINLPDGQPSGSKTFTSMEGETLDVSAYFRGVAKQGIPYETYTAGNTVFWNKIGSGPAILTITRRI